MTDLYLDPVIILQELEQVALLCFRELPHPYWLDELEWSPTSTFLVQQSAENKTIESAEHAVARANERLGKTFPEPRTIDAPPALRLRARKILDRLYVDVLVDTAIGLDYALELRRREPLAGELQYSAVLYALISVAGTEDGLDRENHQYGYHFHHVSLRRGIVRTNVLLTFEPAESIGPPDTLYWQHHGGYLSADPTRWGDRRRIAIHFAARPSLKNPGKAAFLAPNKHAAILYRR